jgi:UDP-GlcNAc:undecaprenyl-phosphate/decaprenyl-phosphate GlcNAc-1-phosphate transferase
MVCRPLANRFGWLDHPGGIKVHEAPTPLIGGPAIYLGIVLAIAYAGSALGVNHLLLDIFPLLLLGLVDDIWKLRPSSRLIIQVAVVAHMILAHQGTILSLGNLLGTGNIQLGFLAIPFTLFALVGLINAINLSDGMDGLAAGYSFVALALMAAVAYTLGATGLLTTLAICLGAIGAFLIFNLRHPWRARASIFLGDSGSLLLGMVLGIAAYKITQRPGAHMPPVVALWLLALPLMDTVAIMIRRMARGQSPLKGDRQHLHHLLTDAGFSHGQGVAVLLATSLICGGAAIVAWQLRVPEPVLMLLFLAASLAYLWFTFHPARAVAGAAALRRRMVWA